MKYFNSRPDPGLIPETCQVQVGGRFALNNVGMIRRLAQLDVGIILMPREVLAEDLDQGRLLSILPDWHGTAIPVYALTETRLLPAKTQKLIDFLRTRFDTQVQTLSA